jgi:hypothetical protein
MKINILGTEWKIKVLADSTFRRKHGNYCAGVTIPEDRIIEIRKSDFTFETIAHEVCHAYMTNLTLIELNPNPDQIEEFVCEIVAKHSPAILATSTAIQSFFASRNP